MTIITAEEIGVQSVRKESDSFGVVEVPTDKLWGAQTQRSLQHFSIGKDLIPREMIASYAVLKRPPRLPTTTVGDWATSSTN